MITPQGKYTSPTSGEQDFKKIPLLGKIEGNEYAINTFSKSEKNPQYNTVYYDFLPNTTLYEKLVFWWIYDKYRKGLDWKFIASKVAQDLQVSRSTIYNALNGLEEKGFIKRPAEYHKRTSVEEWEMFFDA